MITKRNLLCVKEEEKLDLGRILLYKPYKNILVNFKELCLTPTGEYTLTHWYNPKILNLLPLVKIILMETALLLYFISQ